MSGGSDTGEVAMKHPYLAFTAVVVFSVGLMSLVAGLVLNDADLGQVVGGLVILAAGIVLVYVWERSP